MLNQSAIEIIISECRLNKAQLVAVTKTRSLEELQELYASGQRHFGENRVQDLLEKQEVLPKDIKWHLIGHLQTNKVKYIASFITMIHSVDSLKLLEEIEKEAAKVCRVIPCLLQIHVAEEESKFGIPPSKIKEFVKEISFKNLEHVSIEGIMGMASLTDNEAQVRQEFKQLKQIFDELRNSNFKENTKFKTLSMGMSGDYQIALEEGSTMVRVGSKLFN